MSAPTIPKGTYDCVVRSVDVRRRKSDGKWILEVIVRAVHLDRELVVYQDLADAKRSDAFDVTNAQCKSIVRFAERLGIMFDWAPPIGALPIRKLPLELAKLIEHGEVVQATVTHGGGHQKIALYRPNGLLTITSMAVGEWPDAEADSAPYAEPEEGRPYTNEERSQFDPRLAWERRA